MDGIAKSRGGKEGKDDVVEKGNILERGSLAHSRLLHTQFYSKFNFMNFFFTKFPFQKFVRKKTHTRCGYGFLIFFLFSKVAVSVVRMAVVVVGEWWWGETP
jgi:hypothetical protein